MYKVGSTVIGVSLIAWRQAVCLRALSNSGIGVSYCSSNMLPSAQHPRHVFLWGSYYYNGVGVELRAVEGVGFKFNRVNFPGEGRLYPLATVTIGGNWTLLLAHKFRHQLAGSGDIHRCCHRVCQIMRSDPSYCSPTSSTSLFSATTNFISSPWSVGLYLWFIMQNTTMKFISARDLRFSRRWLYKLLSYGMWRSVVW